MNRPIKQHLIDPEICIRCHACVEACPIDAITFDDVNVVVNQATCTQEMSCIGPCPTGAIDNWRVVLEPYTLEEQLGWMELPEQADLTAADASSSETIEAMDDVVAALLATAHQGAGGSAKAPVSASHPTININGTKTPMLATVQGNFRLTGEGSDADVRHIILDLGGVKFPILEGQTVGVIAPGLDENGRAHGPRLYSVSSPRDGERPNTNNLSLTVKREDQGICSRYLCDLKRGDRVSLIGPFGSTFLIPNDPQTKLIMICTGTGAAPFRGFTMHRQRVMPDSIASMKLFFGARTPDQLPYFGPLEKVPQSFLEKHFAFSRVPGAQKIYVQDKLRADAEAIAPMLVDANTYIYICGKKVMETGVEAAFQDIARGVGLNWSDLRQTMRESGRYHVETY
ncbi:MAG: benzoyl-CoA 2,3-epoxidase subunit BoxA [Proteobacteria bacterium]|nr:benzoyl-CoA 2,3-epoxidase subunit BoxA [Pseudomonadota bacterium]MDA1286663.1 benzoyl-CoA 2,3-epoxidase subunit BoxA [Pseudomonadota bacterium]